MNSWQIFHLDSLDDSESPGGGPCMLRFFLACGIVFLTHWFDRSAQRSIHFF